MYQGYGRSFGSDEGNRADSGIKVCNQPSVKFVQKMVGVKQDGACGSKTVTAIKTYQRKHKLTVTGVADYKTLLKMIGG